MRVHGQTNIACDFIVEIKRTSMTESKEMIYKKHLNNEIIKKYLFYLKFIVHNNLIKIKYYSY